MNLVLFVFLSLSVSFLLYDSLAFAVDEDDDNDKTSNIATAEKDGLYLTLESDQIEYKKGQPVPMKWNVENISSEPITFQKHSTCHDGFFFSIKDDNGDLLHSKLSSSVLNIPKNDPNLAKFGDPQFYGQMLESAENNTIKEHGISIVTNNADKLEKMLIRDHDVSKVYRTASSFDVVRVKIGESEIPKIAKYDEVLRIRDGEGRVCGNAMIEGTLQPGQILERNYSWSQMIAERENNIVKSIDRISEGDYTATVGFHDFSTNITIKLVSDDSSSGDSDHNIKIDETSELALYSQQQEKEEMHPDGFEQLITQPKEDESKQSITQIKNDLRSAAENSPIEISAQEFVSVTKRLLEHDIVTATVTDNVIKYENDDANDGNSTVNDKDLSVPAWITQNTVSWWTSEQISDDDFIYLIEWLLNNKVIRLD